jgi:hypothetical protein
VIQAEGHDDLSPEELTAIIATYRGHSNGLAGLTQQALSALLRHHMVRSIPPQDCSIADGMQKAETPDRRIKRERNKDVEMREGEKKRKPEVIDLTE